MKGLGLLWKRAKGGRILTTASVARRPSDSLCSCDPTSLVLAYDLWLHFHLYYCMSVFWLFLHASSENRFPYALSRLPTLLRTESHCCRHITAHSKIDQRQLTSFAPSAPHSPLPACPPPFHSAHWAHRTSPPRPETPCLSCSCCRATLQQARVLRYPN